MRRAEGRSDDDDIKVKDESEGENGDSDGDGDSEEGDKEDDNEGAVFSRRSAAFGINGRLTETVTALA